MPRKSDMQKIPLEIKNMITNNKSTINKFEDKYEKNSHVRERWRKGKERLTTELEGQSAI